MTGGRDPTSTCSVAVYVLRKVAGRTQVLLPRGGRATDGGWCPSAATMDEDEREADAAVRRAAEEVGARPDRLYALPILAENRDAAAGPVGRIGLFVAFVSGSAALEPEAGRSEWLDFDEAARTLASPAERDVLAEVRARFVRRPPDEALRIE